jgi:putative RNA 2'-phosphotransferase
MASNDSLTHASKFLSFVLRHEPGAIGLSLDPQGWVPIVDLLAAANKHGEPLTRTLLDEIVRTNSKQRFAVSDDGLRIRANQGHSVDVDLQYEPKEPPEWLFHGTHARVLDAIRAEGLKKMDRHHVHLAASEPIAREVGARRGKPIVLRVAAKRMFDAGHVFYLSNNGVWLTEHVAPAFIGFD